MRALVLASSLVLIACEGQVGELGDEGAPQAVIRDRSGPELVDFTCAAATIATRQVLDCTAQARHPTDEALRCSLDPGAGQSVIELGDCTAARTTALRYGSPGLSRLTLTVVDLHERAATRSFTVQVTGLPNQPPTVEGLTASRLSGVAPLQTTLSWTSNDPEGDPVSCALDVGADGTIEHPSVDCATWTLALRTVGPVPVKVIATDSGGLTSDRTVTLTVAPPTADLRIAAVEFGQTVMKAGLKLVADKPALLRVVVLANEAAMSTTVEVEARQGGTVLGRQVLAGPAVVPLAASPGDLSRSFRFMMPRAWVVPGVSLRVSVDPEDAALEADETNNLQVLTPAVGRDNVLHLTSVPVVCNGLTGEPLDLQDTVTSLWPVKGVEAKTRAPYTFPGTLSAQDTGGWAQLLGQLAQVQGADGSDRAYYGFVKAGFGGGVAGIGYVGQHVATGRDDYAVVAAHELGHNFGLPHAPCGGASGSDPSYPYPGAKIGTWGFNGAQLMAPTQFVDVMSYCTPVWVSDHNYERAQRHMEGNQTFDPSAVLPSVTPQDSLLIAGRLSSGGATLFPVYRIQAVPSAAVDSEERLHLTTVDGRQLEVPVTLMRPAEGDEVHFFTVIPWPGELARLAFKGAVLEASPLSLSAEVTVERIDPKAIRVRWQGGATATIAHLGAERTTLSIGATGGSAVIRTDGLEGGRYEVSLSNGLRSLRTVLTPSGE